jgi:translation initiation factor IF-2
MRLVQVAKILGMTGQDLRKELSQVNLGVRPTDREIPDQLARGVIRFLANKRGITVNMDTLMTDADTEEETEEASSQESENVSAAADQSVPEQAPPVAPAPQPVVSAVAQATPQTLNSVKPTGLRVMRKLTLEGVSREAIAQQERVLNREGGRGTPGKARPQKGPVKPKPSTSVRNQEQIKKKEGPVALPDMITVKELAEKTGIQIPQLIQTLMKSGVLATINQSIDFETASIVAAELGVTAVREEQSATAEQLITRNLQQLLKDDVENLTPRPPIVVVMGHVDHGKTSLLDAIRSSDVAKGEAGGITQHIGAYQVEHTSSLVAGGPHKITFLDTPGHEAFTAMRARGAQVTDIVILVVSAEEGVKATTVEAIDHAKDAGVPIIVAITKIDKERADVDRVKGEVAGHGLQPEEWGGTIPFVPCSAVTKQGIADILDHILLIAEERKVAANPSRKAVATVIESHLDTSLGPLATVLVNTGTLAVGDIVVCGQTLGRVKALIDSHGKRISTLAPSGAARLSGLESVLLSVIFFRLFHRRRKLVVSRKRLWSMLAVSRSGALPILSRV